MTISPPKYAMDTMKLLLVIALILVSNWWKKNSLRLLPTVKIYLPDLIFALVRSTLTRMNEKLLLTFYKPENYELYLEEGKPQRLVLTKQ